MDNDAGSTPSVRPGAHAAKTPRQELAAAMSEIKRRAGEPSLYRMVDLTAAPNHAPYISVRRGTVQKVFAESGGLPRWQAFESILCVLDALQKESSIRVLWAAARSDDEERGETTQEINPPPIGLDSALRTDATVTALRDGRFAEAERNLQRAFGGLLGDVDTNRPRIASVGRLLIDAQIMAQRWAEATATAIELLDALRTFVGSPGLAVRHWLLTSDSVASVEVAAQRSAMLRSALSDHGSGAAADVIAQTLRENLYFFAGQDRPRPSPRHDRGRPIPMAEAAHLLQIQAATSVLGANDLQTLSLRLHFCRLLTRTYGAGAERSASERGRLVEDLTDAGPDESGAVLVLRHQASQLIDPTAVDHTSWSELEGLLFADGDLAAAHRLSIDYVSTLRIYAEALVRHGQPGGAETAIGTLSQIAVMFEKAAHDAAEQADWLRLLGEVP